MSDERREDYEDEPLVECRCCGEPTLKSDLDEFRWCPACRWCPTCSVNEDYEEEEEDEDTE